MREVGRLIERQRQLLSITQTEIGKRFTPPVTPQFIYHIESGIVRLPLTRAKQICEILKLDPKELATAYVADVDVAVKDALGVRV
jgi:predicted transcriptional regulator